MTTRAISSIGLCKEIRGQLAPEPGFFRRYKRLGCRLHAGRRLFAPVDEAKMSFFLNQRSFAEIKNSHWQPDYLKNYYRHRFLNTNQQPEGRFCILSKVTSRELIDPWLSRLQSPGWLTGPDSVLVHGSEQREVGLQGCPHGT
uniref:Uncharacterized protein n=1 Tax=Schistocephalus solidus TaxID=70667 RepID=A0A0X3NJ42_SCHSO